MAQMSRESHRVVRSLVFALTLLTVATTGWAASGEKLVKQWVAALNGDRVAVAAALSREFVWKEANGATFDKQQFLDRLSGSWGLDAQRSVEEIRDLGTVISFTLVETSALHRQLGHPGDRTRVTVRLHGAKFGTAQAEAVGEPLVASARFQEFSRWLTSRNGDEARRLLPAGALPADGDSARVLVKRANEFGGAASAD